MGLHQLDWVGSQCCSRYADLISLNKEIYFSWGKYNRSDRKLGIMSGQRIYRND